MCGIAGFVLPQAGLARADIEARLWAMIGTLRHRGPDDEGVWTDGLAALAHARRSTDVVRRGPYDGPAAVWIDGAELLA